MSIDHETHTGNIKAMRKQFLDAVAAAAPRNERTTYAEWDAAVRDYLSSLRPWLKDDDLILWPHPEFGVLPGSSLPFSIYGYGYFRAWLRKHNLDPEAFRPAQPPSHGTPGDAR